MDSDNLKITTESAPPENKKKKLIIILGIIILIIALLAATISLIEAFDRKKGIANTTKRITYSFDHDAADYGENIFEDEDYIALIENGFIYFTDLTGVTVEVDTENLRDYNSEAVFLTKYVLSMIYAEVDNYNSFHTEECLKNRPWLKKTNFTMQKIYDVKISTIDVNDDGTVYQMSLSYRIKDNNGTVRDDFIEGYCKQNIILSDKTGNLLIQDIY